jgi:hypothetical protein
MKKFINLNAVIAFLLGAILFSGIGVYAVNESENFHSHQIQSTAITATTEPGGYPLHTHEYTQFIAPDEVGIVSAPGEQLVTYRELVIAVKNLQAQIDELKKD